MTVNNILTFPFDEERLDFFGSTAIVPSYHMFWLQIKNGSGRRVERPNTVMSSASVPVELPAV